MAQLQGNKSKIAAGVIATALLVAVPFIGSKEGDKLDSYKDVVGVWTVCEGITGPQVKPGVHMTKTQCDQLDNSTIGQFMTSVANRLTVEVSAKTLAAHTSFAYNIGLAAYARSKTLKLTNQGKLSQGCYAMANWEVAGGKDCRLRENHCYGLVERRTDEIALCLEGI